MIRLGTVVNNAAALSSFVGIVFWVLVCWSAPSAAQDPKNTKSTVPGNLDSIAVQVDSTAIRSDRVEFYLEQTIPQWPVAELIQPRLRAEALEHLIRRQLIANSLQRGNYAATATEISWRLDELREGLARVDQQLSDHLKKMRLTESELKQEIAWQIAWQKFLDEKLTDEAIGVFYDQHRRDFDGTEIRVAQILFEPSTATDATNQTMERAIIIKQQLVAGQLSWNDAVKQFSTAPSKQQAGELGWIRRHEPMPKDFSVAVFRLEVGKIADPFQTAFGTHIVKCLEIRPGKKLLGDVREEVLRASTENWFRTLSNEARQNAVIKYFDLFPHFLPDGKLWVPNN
jgi:parvulin-like peptidyl-prolyl isomerase